MLLLLQVFSMSALEVFRDDEMEVLLCGAGEHWTPQQLADSMRFDHGYTAQSMPVRCAGWLVLRSCGCMRAHAASKCVVAANGFRWSSVAGGLPLDAQLMPQFLLLL